MKNMLWSSETQDVEEMLDEQENLSALSIPEDKTVIVLCDLGYWNGRRKNAAILGNVTNYGDIVTGPTGSTECEFYCDEDEMKMDESHHDGTNYYTYRLVNEEIVTGLRNGTVAANNHEYLLAHSEKMAAPIKELYGWN